MLVGPPSTDGGAGRARLVHAPFEIDTTQPLNHLRLRFDLAYDHHFPDRAEYFWAKTPGPRGPNGTRGPNGKKQLEPSVDYQDIRFQFELGGPRFSTTTEIPLRFVNGSVYGASGGMGDMTLTTKTVMLDGKRWQITQVFRTFFSTGSPSRGTGNGHFSLEPGVAFRYKWSDLTYLHSDMRYWFALGGDPTHAGRIFRYGFGVSHLYYETDTFALIPTLEFVGWAIQGGGKNLPGVAMAVPVNGEHVFNLYPGMRIVFDTAGDLGLMELGIGGGFALSEQRWYRGLLRLDARWSF